LPEAGYPSGQGAVRACLTRLPAKGVVCVCAVRFQDVESARAAFAMGQVVYAAFAMGQVVYRCLFCGGEHVSGTQDGR
jgi:hypothetical protein